MSHTVFEIKEFLQTGTMFKGILWKEFEKYMQKKFPQFVAHTTHKSNLTKAPTQLTSHWALGPVLLTLTHLTAVIPTGTQKLTAAFVLTLFRQLKFKH